MSQSTWCCKSCSTSYKRKGDLVQHQNQAAGCKWVLEDRRTRPSVEIPDYATLDELEEDPPYLHSAPAACDMDNVDMHMADFPSDDAMHDSMQAPGMIGDATEPNTTQEDEQLTSDNPYYPFENRLDWEVAQWAIEEGPGQSAFTRLLNIDGVQEKLGLSYKDSHSLNQIIDQLPALASWQKSIIQADGVPGEHELYFCDPIECIRALYGNLAFLDHMKFAPEHQFTDSKKLHWIINEMTTADWMWKAQEALPNGSTVVPVILSSDKTQLTIFNGDATAYPVYITIGLISSAIRWKPSYCAQMLLGYLPTSMDDGDLSDEDAHLAHSHLFHCSMTKIIETLKIAGQDGLKLTSADGAVCQCFPIVSCYVADYPEQCLVTCTWQNRTCPKCHVVWDDLGSGMLGGRRKQKETLRTLKHAEKLGSARKAQEALKTDGLNFIPQPFFVGLPFMCIHTAITSDVLHQLFQGLEDHLIEWTRILMGDSELDAWFKRLPPMHGMRHFTDGISRLTNVSAKEHKEMCKQFLGCIVNCLDIPASAVKASRGLLDFIHLAQYKSHSMETLAELEAALKKFHENKEIFIKRENHFNLPKLHSAEHYLQCIRLFGTMDNYNTETTERYHIYLAKDAYRATNKKDYFEQMTQWLERQEKMKAFAIPLAKAPSVRKVTFDRLVNDHGATGFESALKTFIASYKDPANPGRRARRSDDTMSLPFTAVDLWYRVKFAVPELHDESEPPTLHTAHAEPLCQNQNGTLHARFDTVLVNETSDSEERGMKGKRVARLRAIFKIPEESVRETFGSAVRPPGPLAYIEWFTRAWDKDPNNLMFRVSQCKGQNGRKESAIIELDTIFRECHLLPKFEARANRAWTSLNVLDRCDHFFINDFADHHLYQTIW
ncbi:hypothetical protein NEOLEDRAFT_1156454 [Neolentinus lepideus HHB14362 ss-1]|uniref:DUF6830 domain-containing protein n=1 Tax=Neolentinus lepideus HHB14362 ss-1 TaxID=1314782 RepID=A0A165SBD9_9AGAM|nr:hypothetical protein NEOLEDRAFT_1156454 [Neolentinus lepideus HHB14362 ss-1]